MVVAGVGLLGASMALAARRAGVVEEVIGYGRGEESLHLALKERMIDAYFMDAAEFPEGVDLLIVATPVQAIVPTVRAFAGRLGTNCIITDVGSVKARIVRDMEKLLGARRTFIGGHPIAGSEQWGPQYADPDLFVERRCILTPTQKTAPRVLEKVACFWQSLGAMVEFMDPRTHDRVLAVVSHLPHIAAYALVNTLGGVEIDSINLKAYCGAGFKDITRIASSRPELWRDICLANREAVTSSLSQYIRQLRQLKNWIRKGEGERLDLEFSRANELRRQFP
jgi:prephenate dehydrogenase